MLSDLYNDEIKRQKDMAFIAESVILEPIVDPEDDEVDVDAVPKTAIDKANDALDQIVSKKDYDVTDLQELMDDDDDEDSELDVIITEAISEMDKAGEE